MDPQVDKLMAVRSKDCPLAAKWAAIKGKHKAVSNRNIFKGDLDSPLKAYDDAVQAYADAIGGKKELADTLKAMFANLEKVVAEINKLKAERDKSEDEAAMQRDLAAVQKLSQQPDADTGEVTKNLESLGASYEKAAKLHKQVAEQIIATGMTQVDVVKKGCEEYKAKANKLESALQKAYDASDKAQAELRSVLSDFISIADDIENADLQKQLQGLYKFAAS